MIKEFLGSFCDLKTRCEWYVDDDIPEGEIFMIDKNKLEPFRGDIKI